MKDKNTLLSPCQPRLETIVLWALKQILEVSIRHVAFFIYKPSFGGLYSICIYMYPSLIWGLYLYLIVSLINWGALSVSNCIPH